MRVLVIGNGGREHALAWKLAESPSVDAVVSAPGNPGMAGLGPTQPVDPSNPAAVVETARRHRIDLVVVGPEGPLAAGLVDALTEKGIPAFGPDAAGARLEASKAYAKGVMERAGVPTAASASFSEPEPALRHLATAEPPYVVKADGLAGGKGVLVTDDRRAAEAWVRYCFEGRFGPSGSTVVVEEHLEGREVSVFALCDGERALPLQPARDYKRLGDGDTGPNTGGMGCFSPVDDLSPSLVDDTMETVIRPVLGRLAEEGVAYRGFLYAGLMLTADGPKVLEFNVRLGDPETQVLLPRLDEDLGDLLAAGAAGTLPDRPLAWTDGAAVGVVLASEGYPGRPATGAAITGLEEAAAVPGVIVFQAGTALDDGVLVTGGGRVLNVVGTGPDVAAARAAAYEAVGRIRFAGVQYRRDIAARDTGHGSDRP